MPLISNVEEDFRIAVHRSACRSGMGRCVRMCERCKERNELLQAVALGDENARQVLLWRLLRNEGAEQSPEVAVGTGLLRRRY